MSDASLTKWTMSLASSAPLESWLAAAEGLRAVLDAISTRVTDAYENPVVWVGQGMDAGDWSDAERIAADMERLINTDEFGVVRHRLGSSGVVQGHLDGRDLINLRWRARHDATPMQCVADFLTPPHGGAARPLAEHDPAWLADLLLDGVSASNPVRHARISTDAWTDVLIDQNVSGGDALGAVSYSSQSIDPNGLPNSLRVARQTPAGTAIVVKDLQSFASDPASLLDDLLALEQQIGTARATT